MIFFSVPVVSGWHDVNWGTSNKSLVITIDTAINDLLDNCYNYFTNGSGMIFKSMVSLDINISGVKAKDTAFKDHTFGHRNLIDKYEITRIVRKGVIDVQELSDRCFIFSLAAALKHTDYDSLECKENPENYIDFIKENFIMKGIKFPIKHKDIQKFVDMNPHLNVSIDVYTLVDNDIDKILSNIEYKDELEEFPPLKTKVNLLALFPKTSDGSLKPAHFVCISDISRLLGYRDSSGRKQYRHVCNKCKMQFHSDTSEKYLRHKEFCTNHFNQLQDMPQVEDRIEFSQFSSQYLEEIVIFYDLESMLISAEIEKTHCNNCLGICKCYDETKKSFTVKKQNHHPNVYSYCVVDKNGKILEQESQVCEENKAHVKLLRRLLDIQEKYVNMAKGKFKKTPIITPAQREKMMKDQDSKCNHCFKYFTVHDPPVLDHCHYDNEINALLHQSCNLNRPRKKRLPVIAHNAMR